jgi:hypothetical protein
MIAATILHLAIHWQWVVSMARRTWNEMTGKRAGLNWRGRFNLIINASVALSFTLTALNGIYFLFVPGGRWAADPMLLFPRTTWDLIHTWAGVALIASAVIHFAIHWKWVTKVTHKMFGMVIPSRSIQQPAAVTHS